MLFVQNNVECFYSKALNEILVQRVLVITSADFDLNLQGFRLHCHFTINVFRFYLYICTHNIQSDL